MNNAKLEAVLDKVTKLRTLAARATTQAEAEAAAAQAEALIAKYQIDECEIEAADSSRTESVGEYEPLWTGASRHSWIGMLAHNLAKDHGCAIVSEKSVAGVRIRMAGRPSDVAIVRYLFAWLHVEIERLSEREHGRAAKHAFRVGCVAGVLAAMREARTAESRSCPPGPRTSAAMVLVDRAGESMGHLKSVIGGTFTKGRAMSVSDGGAFGRGKAAGGNLSPRAGLGAGRGAFMLGAGK